MFGNTSFSKLIYSTPTKIPPLIKMGVDLDMFLKPSNNAPKRGEEDTNNSQYKHGCGCRVCGGNTNNFDDIDNPPNYHSNPKKDGSDSDSDYGHNLRP